MKAILAVLIIAGILYGAYLIGFSDGEEAEKKRRRIRQNEERNRRNAESLPAIKRLENFLKNQHRT